MEENNAVCTDVYIDITCTSLTNYISGIQRVVRRGTEALLNLRRQSNFCIHLLRWNQVHRAYEIIENSKYLIWLNGNCDLEAVVSKRFISPEKIPSGAIFFDLDSVWPIQPKRQQLFPILKHNGVKIAVLVYDVIPITDPQYTDGGASEDFLQYFAATLLYADVIFTTSEFVKAEIQKLKPLERLQRKEPQRFFCASLGSDFEIASLSNPRISDKAKAIVQRGPYLLTVSTIEPRKNHKILLDAYDQFLCNKNVNIVFAGRKGWNVDDLLKRLYNHPDYGKRLFHVEGANDETISYLYQNAFYMVFPSYLEGYGIPVVESMIAGTPVLLSDIPVMREVAGSYGEFFSPDNAEELSKHIIEALDSPEVYDQRKEALTTYKATTWADFGNSLVAGLALVCKNEFSSTQITSDVPEVESGIYAEAVLEDILYEKLVCNDITARTSTETPCLTPEESASAYIREISGHISTMEATRQNYAFRHIYSVRKIIGPLIVFFKRVVRKLLKWYIEPICDQQTEFNNAVTPSIGRLTELSQRSINDLRAVEELSRSNQDSLRAVEELSRTSSDALTVVENAQKEAKSRMDDIEDAQARDRDAFRTLLNALQSQLDEDRYQEGAQLGQILTDIQILSQEIEFLKQQNNTLQEQLGLSSSMADELQKMLKISVQRISDLESDMTCIHKVNHALFDKNGLSFWDKDSVSQSGEDCIVAYIAMEMGYRPEQVTYLDLGANHAKDMSNTYYFYNYGARGVLVEANPDLIPELRLYRSGDVILNRCVSTEDGNIVEFYILNGDGISSMDKKRAEQAIAINEDLYISRVVQVQTISVNTILEQYFDVVPFLLNIDIEGCDTEILEAMDFERFRPKIIICEAIPYRKNIVVGEKDTELVEFLLGKDYIEYAFTGINCIFIDKRELRERGIL